MARKLKKQIEDLQASVEELKSTVITQELTRLRENNNKYKEMCENVSKITLGIKNIRLLEDDEGRPYVEVTYKTPVLHIPVNEDGKIIRNEFFRSVNLLNLLPQSDMDKIAKVLSEAERKAKI